MDPLEKAILNWPGDADCDVQILTVATKMEIAAQNLLASLRRYGYRHRVIGFGQQWKGWRQRMAWYRDTAREYPADALLVFLDAYDVVAARSWRGICDAFSAVAGGAGIVSGMEALCGENCGNIGPWWDASKRTPASPFKYINGGMIMGRAGTIAAAYEWILKDPRHFTDDQIGLAAYANAHPSAYAPDDGRRLVSNKHAFQQLTQEEKAGAGAFFLHYPGLNKAPLTFPLAVYPIQEAWAAHAGPLAVMRMPSSPFWEKVRAAVAVVGVLLLLAVGAALGLAARALVLRVKARSGGAAASSNKGATT